MSWGIDSGPGIQVIPCRRPGIERYDMPRVIVPPIVCDDCHAAWKARRDAGSVQS